MPGPTLIKPPPLDPSKSAMENVLDLTTLSEIGPDIFTNTRELWHPPNARGVYGGAVVAQSLAAAQKTIPSPSAGNGNAEFLIHSMHCYFVLAGDATIPILYHVERVREGKSFMTRTVQARQRGKCIFTTTASFVREGSGGAKTVDHSWDMPEGVQKQLEAMLAEDGDESGDKDGALLGVDESGPFITKRLGIVNQHSPHPQTKKTRQWLRARGQISSSGGIHAHLSALAYMSDSYFIGTVSRIHNLWRFARPNLPPNVKSPLSRIAAMEAAEIKEGARGIVEGRLENGVGMMVSLDHTIYFHRPREIKADEWLCAEMESPWAGEGRGLVLQKIWNRQGKLVASCVQEGLVRLKQDGTVDESKSKL